MEGVQVQAYSSTEALLSVSLREKVNTYSAEEHGGLIGESSTKIQTTLNIVVIRVSILLHCGELAHPPLWRKGMARRDKLINDMQRV